MVPFKHSTITIVSHQELFLSQYWTLYAFHEGASLPNSHHSHYASFSKQSKFKRFWLKQLPYSFHKVLSWGTDHVKKLLKEIYELLSERIDMDRMKFGFVPLCDANGTTF